MMIEIARVLVGAGATHASAARAAVILDAGGSVKEAEAEIVLAPIAERFDVELLLAEARRAAAAVKVEALR